MMHNLFISFPLSYILKVPDASHTEITFYHICIMALKIIIMGRSLPPIVHQTVAAHKPGIAGVRTPRFRGAPIEPCRVRRERRSACDLQRRVQYRHLGEQHIQLADIRQIPPMREIHGVSGRIGGSIARSPNSLGIGITCEIRGKLPSGRNTGQGRRANSGRRERLHPAKLRLRVKQPGGFARVSRHHERSFTDKCAGPYISSGGSDAPG